ncbi:hypothetical protein Phum_PHUM014200 [Pediculus humanus corporis]|uniref:Uncharacterized protein n=1 Tax=Pediculus humanus subsp. corporis TaxID=121224 RepID=E0V9J6_PEDHC|nr:uncharacterized protein Phum_PHUM014200 [Pediculus humanus corporis]EEB10052.1 hypothetical protein Phum_PHUM014200 [Pediculus humanus corporis]
MDIIEISRKLEGDLLESKTKEKISTITSFSPRITRSKTYFNEIKKNNDSSQQTIKPSTDKLKENIEVMENVLVKKTRRVQKHLETIYEHPIWKKGNTIFLGKSKVKRSLYLDREFRRANKQKTKHRKNDEFKNKMLQLDHFLNDNNVDINSLNNDNLELGSKLENKNNETQVQSMEIESTTV